ncbi:unnamed protein product [Closterium sp. NIES-54]
MIRHQYHVTTVVKGTVGNSTPTATTAAATTLTAATTATTATLTPTTATTATTEAPIPSTTPTAATTSATSTASITTTPAATATTLATVALAAKALPTKSRSSPDILSTKVLYLLSDSKDSVSLFFLASGAAPAPPATADSSTRSQWLTRDAAARLAIHNHLPLAECDHFGQHRMAQALYDDVVARYSSPATASLGHLLLPYLFSELSAFTTVEDLISQLRASDSRYRAAVPAEDHFLSLDPTSLTVDLLEQHLLAAESSAVAVGAARGTPRPPFFEGCSPSPLAPSYASAAAAADVSVPEDVGAASASAKCRSINGKGGQGGGGGSGSGGRGSNGGGGGGASVGGSGGSDGCGGGSGGSGGSGGGGTGSGGTGTRRVGSRGGQRRSETSSPQQLAVSSMLSTAASPASTTLGVLSLCVPPDLGIAAAALGASESGTLPGTVPAEALHTFTLDSGASRCFFRDSTTLNPHPAPVPVRLADPFGGLVVACSSTVLPCPASAALQDVMVTTTTPGGQRVSICTCTRTGRHLAMFTRRPGSSLYTLATEPPQVAESAQVSASGQVAASCSCRLLSHATLLWHHGLGHPSLPRLRGMHSRLLHAAAHSSSFPPTSAPLQTLHMDVWGPTHVSGQSRKRYLQLVVDDYTRYTTVFPLRNKGQVVDVLIPWIRTVRLQLREHFGQDLPVLRLHSNKGGEFSSNLLWDFCRGEGILQSFTLPDSPQKNWIAERRIGLVLEVARTSMIHAAAPHFLWPFAVRYAAHQLKRWPPNKLSPRAILCVFLGFVPDASCWQFYHPTSRHVLPSKDVTFDESVPFYRLFPYRSAPPPPSPLFLGPGPPPVDPLPNHAPGGAGAARGAASGGASSGGAEPGGAGSEGAEPGGVGTGGAEPGGAETEGVEPGSAASEGAEYGGAEPKGAASSGGSAGASLRLSPQQLPSGAGGAVATGTGGARTRGTGAAGL